MTVVTSFHTDKCCHLVSEHEASHLLCACAPDPAL